MNDRFGLRITPEPRDEDREAILAAVNEVLRAEAELARPAIWRLAGWTQMRAGLADLRPWATEGRRWTLSTRLPSGGRAFPGLYGRGDAK